MLQGQWMRPVVCLHPALAHEGLSLLILYVCTWRKKFQRVCYISISKMASLYIPIFSRFFFSLKGKHLFREKKKNWSILCNYKAAVIRLLLFGSLLLLLYSKELNWSARFLMLLSKWSFYFYFTTLRLKFTFISQ